MRGEGRRVLRRGGAGWKPRMRLLLGEDVLYRRGVSDPPELKPVWRRPNLTSVLEDTVGLGADQI